MEGGVLVGLHQTQPANQVGGWSPWWTPPPLAGQQGGKGRVPVPLGFVHKAVFELGSYSKTLGKPLGFHLYNEEEREGAALDLAAPPRAPLAGALAPLSPKP